LSGQALLAGPGSQSADVRGRPDTAAVRRPVIGAVTDNSSMAINADSTATDGKRRLSLQ